MPMHDWTRVPDGIFHAFHHGWMSELAQRLNADLLPDFLYALPEQAEAGLSLDSVAPVIVQAECIAEGVSEVERFRRKKSAIAIRHVSGDRIVALIEIVSPGNKGSDYPTEQFVRKACDFLAVGVHLLILDPFPPGPRDPNGIHSLIWHKLTAEPFHLPPEKPLTLVAYESDIITRAYVEPVAVGDRLPDMPLFLVPDGCVMVPLEETYQTAFDVQPRRWRDVLSPPSSS